MGEAFDPYYKWLGIAPEEQPPNHYRLLALRLFESDPDVISNAADQRMAHVRSFQAGRHAAASQRILNEVAAARVCLLNAAKKDAYDTALRADLAQRQVAAAQAPRSDTEPSDPLAGLDLPDLAESPVALRAGRPRRRRQPWWFFAAIAGATAAAAVLIIVGTALVRSAANKTKVADRNEGQPAVMPGVKLVPPKAEPSKPEPRLGQKTDAARFKQTSRVGGSGGEPFEEKYPNARLTGFNVTFRNFAGHLVVGSLQPIYMTPDGPYVSKVYGNPGQTAISVQAKPGYAVGALIAKGGQRLDGFKVVFMQIRGSQLDPSQSYESDWVGGQGGGETRIGGDGSPVVGVFGGSGMEFDGLGLIQLE